MMALEDYMREEFGYAFGDEQESTSLKGGGAV